jgi:hypothetical protein
MLSPGVALQLGVRVVDHTILTARVHREVSDYVHECNGAGVLAALRAALTSHGDRPFPTAAYLASTLAGVSPEVRSSFRLSIAGDVAHVARPTGASGRPGAPVAPPIPPRRGVAQAPASTPAGTTIAAGLAGVSHHPRWTVCLSPGLRLDGVGRGWMDVVPTTKTLFVVFVSLFATPPSDVAAVFGVVDSCSFLCWGCLYWQVLLPRPLCCQVSLLWPGVAQAHHSTQWTPPYLAACLCLRCELRFTVDRRLCVCEGEVWRVIASMVV